jgi:hypothetical protein
VEIVAPTVATPTVLAGRLFGSYVFLQCDPFSYGNIDITKVPAAVFKVKWMGEMFKATRFVGPYQASSLTVYREFCGIGDYGEGTGKEEPPNDDSNNNNTNNVPYA